MFEGDREREKEPVFFLCEIMHPSNLPAVAHENQGKWTEITWKLRM